MNRILETIAHLKNTITIGDISSADNLPAIVFPAHPSIHNTRRRIALSIVSFFSIFFIKVDKEVYIKILKNI